RGHGGAGSRLLRGRAALGPRAAGVAAAPQPRRGGQAVSRPGPTSPELEAAGFFVLRTPLLAASVADRLGDRPRAPGTSALSDALAIDRKAVRAKLAELIARPEVREALFVASPSLLESLPDWLRDPDGDKGEKVERALVRYLYRMSSRSTPFG